MTEHTAPVLSHDVAAAQKARLPIVALESTIFSNLGLPNPQNRVALDRVYDAVEARGAVPAVTAVLDGKLRIGIAAEERATICGQATKVAARDLGQALASGLNYGATTVSAALAIAEAAGIEVFATGGIGGVHRGAELTGDISADLPAIARHRTITVSAGAKVFLDLAKTVEYLETLSVPVIGFQCSEFPAFHARSSGIALTASADNAAEVAAAVRAHWQLGGGGVLVVCPVPEPDAFAFDELTELVEQALATVGDADETLSGPGVTPAVLAAMAELSGGRTVAANLSLAENNATVAAEIAAALRPPLTA